MLPGQLGLRRAQRLAQITCRAQDLHQSPKTEGLGDQGSKWEPLYSQYTHVTGGETETESRMSMSMAPGGAKLPQGTARVQGGKRH